MYPYEFITGMLEQNPVKIKVVAQKADTGVDETVSVVTRFANGCCERSYLNWCEYQPHSAYLRNGWLMPLRNAVDCQSHRNHPYTMRPFFRACRYTCE